MEWRRFVTYLWNDPRKTAQFLNYTYKCWEVWWIYIYMTVTSRQKER